jgi:hypothetical protein
MPFHQHHLAPKLHQALITPPCPAELPAHTSGLTWEHHPVDRMRQAYPD